MVELDRKPTPLVVLCAPATRRWQAYPVSEDGWLPTVLTHMMQLAPQLRIVAMVEETEVTDGPTLQLLSVGRRRHELAGSATLPMRMALRATRGHHLHGVDLLHVGLPFAIGRTQSVLAVLARRRGIPVVVGPVQAPQTFLGPDETAAAEVAAGRPRKAAGAWDRLVGSLLRVVDPMLRASNRSLLQSAACVVAVDRTASTLLSDLGVHSTRIAIVPQPLSWTPGCEPPDPGNLRMVPLKLVTASVLIERKAVDQIVEAVAIMRSAGTEVTLTIAGSGPAEPGLRQMVAERGLAQAVEFSGWLTPSELRSTLANATFVVSMSRSESFGVALIDAMAAGVPVISAANQGATSIIRHGATGWLVPVDNPHALARQITTLAHAPDFVRSVAHDGAMWARQTLAPEVVASQWLQVYRHAVARIPGVPPFGVGTPVPGDGGGSP